MVAMAMTAACPLASTSRNAPAPQRPAATAAVALPGVICTRHVLAPLRAGSGFASAFRHHRQQQRRWQPAPSICSVASSSEPAPTQAQEAPAQQLALSSFSSECPSPAVCRCLSCGLALALNLQASCGLLAAPHLCLSVYRR